MHNNVPPMPPAPFIKTNLKQQMPRIFHLIISPCLVIIKHFIHTPLEIFAA